MNLLVCLVARPSKMQILRGALSTTFGSKIRRLLIRGSLKTEVNLLFLMSFWTFKLVVVSWRWLLSVGGCFYTVSSTLIKNMKYIYVSLLILVTMDDYL